MRQIKGERPGDLIRYIPEAYENRNAPKEDRVIVHYRAPTERERRALLSFGDSLDVDPDTRRVQTSVADHWARLENAVSAHVDRVDNYVGRAGPIANGRDLVEHGEPLFIAEIANVILGIGRETENTLGKSEGSPPCCSAATKACNGTAACATPTVYARSETVMGTMKDSNT